MSDLSSDILYIWLHFGENPFKIITFSIFYHLGPPYNATKPAEHVIFLLYPANPQIHSSIYPVNNNTEPEINELSRCLLLKVCFWGCKPAETMCKQSSYADKRELVESHWIIFILSLFLFWNIRGTLPTLHTGYRHSNCVTGFFFPFF